MREGLSELQRQVETRFRSAMLFSVPLFAGLALMLLEAGAGLEIVSQGTVLAILVVGMVLALVPVTRYQRAKSALEKAKKLEQLSKLAAVFEVET